MERFSPVRAAPTKASTVPAEPPGPLFLAGDLVLCALIAVLAAFASALAAPMSGFRLALAVLMLLAVPGYLVCQAAFVPARPIKQRLYHLLISIGVSPAAVAMIALLTALIPGGFRPVAIVVTITVACLGLAGFALYRRIVIEDRLEQERRTAAPHVAAAEPAKPAGNPERATASNSSYSNAPTVVYVRR